MKELATNLYGIIVQNKVIGAMQDWNASDEDTHLVLFGKDGTLPETDSIIVKGKGWEVLGTASEKEITFDCKPYTEKVMVRHIGPFYKLYGNHKIAQYPNKSFMSLIKSKGIKLKSDEKLLVIKKL